MKTKISQFKYLIVFSLFVFSGCSLDSDSSTSKQDVKDRIELQNIYQPMVGTYRGSIDHKSISGSTTPIEVILFLFDEPDGVNENGEVRFRPVLKGHYREIGVTSSRKDHVPLLVRYYQESSEVSLISQKVSSNANAAPELQLKGYLREKVIQGDAFDSLGLIGSFSITKVSDSVSRSPEFDLEERRKLLEIYEPIVGLYQGKINGRQTIKSELRLFIVEESNGTDASGELRYRPSLKGHYRELTQSDSKRVYNLNARYFFDTKELVLVGADSAGVLDQFQLRGITDREKSFTGRAQDRTGVFGNFEFIKTSSDAGRAPDRETDERARLKALYSAFAGSYRGRVSPTDARFDSFPIEIRLFVTEEPDGLTETGAIRFRPALSGYYRRLDTSDYIGDYPLVVRYFVDTNEFSMRSTASTNLPGDGSRGQIGFVSLNGKSLSGARISGDISDHRGPLGRFNVQRR